MGRPSTCTQEAVATICEKLSQGIPLTVICREDDGLPEPRTVYRWMEDSPEVASQIARARSAGHDALAEQCIDIADDECHDWVMSKKGEITNEVAIARAKLRVWTRMQLLAKWDPKRYGDRHHVEHSGKVGLESLVAGDEKSGE